MSWTLLILLAAAQGMVALDVTVVNVALPAIGGDLYFGPGDLQWVVSVYVLVTGGLLLLGGRLSDLIGPRPTFFIGLGVFTMASLTSGIAQSSMVLVVSRALQGLGAALLSPAALSLITRTYSGTQRAKALGAWGAIASGGAAAGLLVGGALTTWLDWRWSFFINIPVGVAVLVLAIRLVPASPRAERQKLDIAGAVIGTAGLAVTLYGISGAAEHGWASAHTVYYLAGGLALLVLFAAVERHAARPLVPPALWGERSLAASTVGIFGATITLVGALFLGAFLLETTMNSSPLRTGVALLPMVVAIAFAAHLGSAVVNHLGAKSASTVGLLVAAVGAFQLSMVPQKANYAINLLPGLAMLGFGLGLTFVIFSITSMADITTDRAGSASGLYMTAHDIGGAFGVAVLSTAAASATSAPEALQTLAGQQRGFLVAAAITVGCALLAAATMPHYRPPADPSGAPKRRSGHGHFHG
ncbi:MFS transporter [Streptomyces sp. NY05-11A]|uniref:MFS transporter n=1 Tax=Streptomyces soliscabiei TaxID=588897 RepID=UPI0029A46A25|nr:MFS transporter [Streptomyces sp. NY05-11A]MDX2679238.1 MFS transporter [Streptomyces sp. NY05-11A]